MQTTLYFLFNFGFSPAAPPAPPPAITDPARLWVEPARALLWVEPARQTTWTVTK